MTAANEMFCYQCEQTAKGQGCTVRGVCGKSPDAARLMDLIVHGCKWIGRYAHRLAQMGHADRRADRFVIDALFVTVTNVNFDPGDLARWVADARDHAHRLKGKYKDVCGENNANLTSAVGSMEVLTASSTDELIAQADRVSVARRQEQFGPTVAGLQELLLYGLKGSAAYAHHARELGKEDDRVYDFFREALDFLCTEDATDVDKLLEMILREGERNLRVMEMLDAGHTERFGHPEPTEVRITPVQGKAILVSGHDLVDLEALLEQTEGTGINVYTHGEMLPALAYPGLKRYDHLVGNYGGAWQDQQREFDEFPGAILMNTNCIQKPKDSYKNRLFTCGLVGWPDVTHIDARDFTPVVEAARAAEGFGEDAPEQTIPIGFARDAVMGVAETVVNAVKEGKLRHFFLIGGCDGAKPGRNYYTQLAEQVPDDCAILTLACGKYRFNKKDFGDIGGIPRLLDVGQCNDAYSAIRIAQALADAFDCQVNDLPLSLILSWYEQKAVCILLTLLYLGIQDMRLGPSLPAFVTEDVLNVLVEKFNIKPISTPQEDLQAMLA